MGAYVVYQIGLKYGRRQATLAARQLHDLQEPQWGDPELEESDAGWIVRLPLLSNTFLESVRLAVVVGPSQTAGLYLEGDDEGAPGGLDMGEAATWRVRVDPQGDPTTKARVTASAGNHEWPKLVDLPLSVYNWRDVTGF